MTTFTKELFDTLFPDEDTCLKIIFQERYKNWDICPICYKRSKFHKVNNRKCFACQRCGYQVFPLAKTLYHKSSTPLKKWFFAIYLYSSNKTITAKEIQRQIAVTYKTAWRMLKQIDELYNQPVKSPLQLIEINEKYIHDFISKMKNSN